MKRRKVDTTKMLKLFEYPYGAKPLPRRIRRLVEDFDSGFDVLPFSFWLPVG